MFGVLNAGESLTAVMSGAAATTNPSYSLLWNNGSKPDQAVGSLAGISAVTLLTTAAEQRLIHSLQIFNEDTAAVTVTIKKVIGGTSYTLATVTLAVGSAVRFTGEGVRVVDSSGQSLQSANRSSRTFQIASRAKVGGTAGWTVGAANDLPYTATMAASQSIGTLVIPIDGLAIGDTITGFKIVAQVESAGGIVTIDAELRAVTNVAAEPTDALIAAMTQVSVTADTAVSQAKTGLSEVVTSGKSYYLLILATTAGSTDIILQHPEISITAAS